MDLEGEVDKSFFNRFKDSLRGIKHSVAGKVAVYSLVGVLSGGFGLSYGCGNGTTKPLDVKPDSGTSYETLDSYYPDNYQEPEIKEVEGEEIKIREDISDVIQDLEVGCDVPQLYCLDMDKDNYGDAKNCWQACEHPGGDYISINDNFDCDDGNPDVWKLWEGFMDFDEDGYTFGEKLKDICGGEGFPAGYQPQASEIEDECDNNKEAFQILNYFADNDKDGFGAGDLSEGCFGLNLPAGFSLVGGDCDDFNNTVYPGAKEMCDSLNNDCDDLTLDGSGEAPPYNSNQKGVCKDSKQTCVGGGWMDDYSGVPNFEFLETLCDSLDNDCDWKIDEDLERFISCGYNGNGQQKQVCGTGNWFNSGSCNDPDVCKNGDALEQECGSDAGECEKGTQYKTCSDGQWGWWSSCQGGINPIDEVCDNKDNDCDGKTDEECLFCWEKTFGGNWKDSASSIQQTKDLGYIAAGYIGSENVNSFGYNSDAWVFRLDANGELKWDKIFGGKDTDRAYSIQQINNGGYIVAGVTESKGAGDYDAWVLKLYENGDLEWDKTFGGSDYDEANSIQQTTDEGYIVAGARTQEHGAWISNVWVLKLKPNGELDWDKIFWGSEDDEAHSIRQTTDLGYIVAGYTKSKGAGYYDAWVLKLEPNGNLEWERTFGGSSYDNVYSIQQTSDLGYIAAGQTSSKTAESYDADAWVLKLKPNGELEWEKIFGGNENDGANSIQQTSDGGYIVAGGTDSKGTGGNDVWVFKLYENGELEWDKTFGGSESDAAYSIQQTFDEGYIMGGVTETKETGKSDGWVLKLDENGNLDCE